VVSGKADEGVRFQKMKFGASLGRRFWQLWAANAVSSVGDGMVLVALPLLALSRTSDALTISAVMVVGQVPVLVAALPIGAVADRGNRRRILVRVEILRFAALALFGALVLTGLAGLTAIFLAAFAFGSLDVVFDVTSASVLPSIVDVQGLASANSRMMNAEAVGQEITGKALGGFLLAVSTSLPFLADAATFVASAILIRKAVPADEPVATPQASTWSDLLAGLVWFFGHPTLRRLTALVASLAFCQSMVLALVALWARQDLRLGAGAYGLLLAIASVGNIVGAVAAPGLRRAVGGGPLLVGVALVAALAYPVMAVSHSTVLAAGALALEAAAVVVGNVAATTMRQRLVPAAMQARGVAAYRTVIFGCLPLGAIAGGVVASVTTIGTAFVLAGGLQLVCAVALGYPLLHRSEAPHVVDLTNSDNPIRFTAASESGTGRT
jgi:hypothetical protein